MKLKLAKRLRVQNKCNNLPKSKGQFTRVFCEVQDVRNQKFLGSDEKEITDTCTEYTSP